MVSLNDIRPLLYTARLFGVGFYSVSEEDITMMKYSIVYSVLFALLYAGLCLYSFYMLRMDNMLEPRLLTLTVVRTVLSYACVLSDIIMKVWCNWKIQTAMSHLRVFDRATRYEKETKTVYRVSYICGALTFVTLLYWSIVGYITFRVEPEDAVFNAVTYAYVNSTISMQLLMFASFSFLLYERFRRLCDILLLPKDGKIMTVIDRSSRHFRLQEVWWLHSCLANATEMINSVYGVQLLLWLSCMSFNTLTRLYTINEGETISFPLLMLREVLLVSACVTNLLIITITCHATAAQANRVGMIAFMPSSAILAKRNFIQDCSVEAVTYFHLRQVHFFALFGIIRIDLPLLLTIASGITTYLVILHTANI
ncbi:uncharacterized protein LOC109853744 isoform X2 [Pseudomyrmex gracilis]|uniref:uncharacterized protein LOC109853744 isoform X2 n=1 Tax=Pseudomyrmex gracilis TaxID=219809 RepID=UPI000995A953|nr:uncharacterized protein LOC109853744 isoform X2 [Pseudomyrmex gracilis]